MIVVRNKKHTFNIDIVGDYSLDQFKKHCEGLDIFKQLPIKERIATIKEAYGIVTGISKKVKRVESVQGLSGSDKGGNGNDSGSKQGAASKGNDGKGKEDKA